MAAFMSLGAAPPAEPPISLVDAERELHEALSRAGVVAGVDEAILLELATLAVDPSCQRGETLIASGTAASGGRDGLVRVVQSLLVPSVCSLLLCCGDGGGDPQPTAQRAHTPGCQAPADTSNEPRSIDETVELVNALPQPLTLPCFVESLGRPLGLHAAQSELSAQPAVGARSPRIFIYLEPLILSVAPAGVGAALLELGEQRESHRSLKGELRFPIERQVEPAEPYEHILFTEDLTACAFCHASEEHEPLVPGGNGYVSQALRPRDDQRVSLALLRAELEACDTDLEAERCALLDALFGWGETPDWDFPPDMATFGG